MSSETSVQLLEKHPLVRAKAQSGDLLSNFEARQALEVCERVAKGDLLDEFCTGKGGYPSKDLFIQWTLRFPEVSRAFSAAKVLSAFALEEQAIAMARELRLKKPNPSQTSAYRTAMEQLRWSAERRNPAQYAGRSNATAIVPIQINTNIGLEPGSAQAPVPSNTYRIEATVVREEETDLPSEDAKAGADARPLPSGPRRSKYGKLILQPEEGQ